MFSEARRIEQMDSQRYDLSKRQRRPTLSIDTIGAQQATVSPSGQDSDRFHLPTPLISGTWADHTFAILSDLSIDSSSNSQISLSGLSESTSPTSADTPATSAFLITECYEEGLASTTYDNEAHLTDVIEKDGFTSIKTIIRPISPGSPLSPIFSLFSRPSTPFQDAGFSRPTCILGALNCLGNTHTFEDEVDYIQAKLETQLFGQDNGTKIEVFTERAAAAQDLTLVPDSIQAVICRLENPDIESATGHVEEA